MFRRSLNSRLVTPALAVALAVSLFFNMRSTDAPAEVQVVAFHRDGPALRPRLLLDFDRPMEGIVERDLSAGMVTLDPPARLRARFLTPRRLEVRPEQPLEAFRPYRIVFGAGFAARDGRPVDASPAFKTGVLGLDGEPRTRTDYRDRPICELRLNGAVRRGDLARHLRLTGADDRAIPFELSGEDEEWELELKAIPERGAHLTLAQGLRPVRGELGVERDEAHELVWTDTLRVIDCDARSGYIELEFSHYLAEQDLRGLVAVTPEPEGLRLIHRGDEIRLRGEFRPRARVTVAVRSGLRTASGLRLAADVERTLQIPDADPEIEIVPAGRTLSTAARPELEISGVNVARPEAVLQRVFENNVVPLALRWRSAGHLAAEGKVQPLDVDALPNESWTRRLDLARMAGGPPRGVFLLTVRDAEDRWVRDLRLLQFTDLAPVVRVREDGLVVFVTRLRDGRPVAGARVEAYSGKNQLCVRGETDADGIFVGRGLAFEPFVVTVAEADDLAYVDLRTHSLAHTPRDVEGRAPATGLEAFLYTDRGVVRPGGTCHVGAIVRTARGDAPAAVLPVTLRLRAGDGRVLRIVRTRSSASGFVAADLPFALDAPTGAYGVELTAPGRDEPLGKTSFRVEAFVPDRIEPALELPEGELRPGAAVSVGIVARRLGGAPAAGQQARLKVHYEPLSVEPVPGYRFGDADAAPEPFTRDEDEVALDDEGRALLQVSLPEGGDLRAGFELSVIDVSGRASFQRVTRRVVLDRPRLGVVPPRREAFRLPVVLVGGEGVAAEAVLERLAWQGAYVHERGRSVWRARLLSEELARVSVPIVDGHGEAAFDDPGDGRFRVRVTADGAVAAAVRFERWDRRTRDAVADGGAPRLSLALLTPEVGPGESARIAVDAPFAGVGLLTVEGPSVLSARRVDLSAGGQELEVEIPDAAGPCVHATLTLVRSAREKTARLLGAVAIPVHRPGRRLSLGLDAPGRVLPGTTLEVTLRSDEPADVRVHVVDEGVLRLTSHRPPDPAQYLLATRRLETRLADAYTKLMERMHFGGDDADPGGGGDPKEGRDGILAQRLDPTAKRTIETVALASETVAVEGERTVRLDLPADYEGRVRVFAVAAGSAGTGRADAAVVVEAPISIAIHMPRAAAPGDRFAVPLQIRGEGVTHRVRVQGLEVLAESPVLELRAGERPGVASVTVEAHDAAGNTVTRTARMSIRPPAPFTVRHVVRSYEPGEEWDEPLPGEWLESTLRARITVGTRPELELLPALERLLEYPHGCVEQTTSRAFPVLALSELAASAHPDGGRPQDTVAAAVDRLLAMQTGDGGLAAWPGNDDSYVFGSIYAAHFLVEALHVGRAVPEEPLDRLLDFLEDRLRAGDGGAYAAYVLTLAKRATGPFLERLAEEARDPEARAHLAAAFTLRGDAERARGLLAEAGDPWAVPRTSGGRLRSPARAAALLLGALLESAPGDPRVDQLARRVGAEARTTQENACALLALARYHAQRAREEAGTRGVLTVDGRDIPFDGSIDAVVQGRWGLRADGPLTVILRVEGVPLRAEAGDLERGLSVRRRIEGGPLRQGRVYRVVIEGVVPPGTRNLLVTDVLPGGLEIEAARDQEGSLQPDRIEPRDDRVLFFRTAPLDGGFRQTYLVRAVTCGRFAVPPVRAELLYDPELMARSGGGGTMEVTAE